MLSHTRLHQLSDISFRSKIVLGMRQQTSILVRRHYVHSLWPLTQRLDNSSLTILKSAALLETSPTLVTWSWYSSTYEQYHTITYLLFGMQKNPNHSQAEKMIPTIDHVFGASYRQTSAQRILDLLRLLADWLERHFKLRGMDDRGGRQSLNAGCR
jgi:hypothetical protein